MASELLATWRAASRRSLSLHMSSLRPHGPRWKQPEDARQIGIGVLPDFHIALSFLAMTALQSAPAFHTGMILLRTLAGEVYWVALLLLFMFYLILRAKLNTLLMCMCCTSNTLPTHLFPKPGFRKGFFM